ncbi:hypothetical protein Y5S_03016 [Alcanivorax nanhaiticus]|uniref:DUF1294 domain-containing protein n=1 Tax=Alcanivorax nanhaiticus TaxID=1177154 RepID=A0A095SHI3_9GAMM|nr:DUF1294 domain-containing protein [Alcanivorax nanhaiticus]KGD63809.1 hypothetical protein Y5S_03016 [Alcanivorax nanhaiticus]
MKTQLGFSVAAVATFFAAMFWLSKGYTFFPFLLFAFALLSLVTLILYGVDKRAARLEKQRTPEKHLHLLALLGGWPGALVARPLFRHKTRKQPFTTIFWCTVLIGIAMMMTLLISEPAAPYRDWLDVEALQWRTGLQQWFDNRI